MSDTPFGEDTYGLLKRFRFIRSFLAERSPRSVLDVGCGTGNNLTVPLSLEFPETRFVGIDPDRVSVDYARQKNERDNLSFCVTEELPAHETFDVVIASEVIEHVEDPKQFLQLLQSRLSPSGRLVLTLPNGFGPFEWGSFCQTVLYLMGLLTVLQKMKHRLLGRRVVVNSCAGVDDFSKWLDEDYHGIASGHDTLAISPHLNFFSYSKIRRLIRSSAFEIEQFRPRTFLCGFGFDQTLHSRMIDWNARIADHLPARANSGWMFILQKSERQPTGYVYRRSWYARFRRYLNEKRWGLLPVTHD